MQYSITMDAYDLRRSNNEEFAEEEFKKMAAVNGETSEFMYQSNSDDNLNRLMDGEFAIILILPNGDRYRRFPIHSKTDLQMSIKAFNRIYDKLPRDMALIISRRFAGSAERYGVDLSGEPWFGILADKEPTGSHFYPITDGMITNLNELFESTKEDGTKIGRFAINHDANSQPFSRFPINTRAQLSRQIEAFEKNAQQWLCSYAIQMAGNLKGRAAELQYSIAEDSAIHKFAGDTFNKYAYHNIMARAHQLKDMEAYLGYRDLAEKVAANKCSSSQAAVALESLDRKHRLNFYWGVGDILHPADSVMSSPKKASVMDNRGNPIDTQKLNKILATNPERIAESLDPDMVERLRNNPDETLKTMSPPQRTVLVDIISREA